jgi:tight adherence protein C
MTDLVVYGGAVAVIASIPVAAWAMRPRRSLADIGDARAEILRAGSGSRILKPFLGALGSQARRLTPKGRIASLERRVVLAGSASWTLERALAAKLLLGLGGLLLGLVWGEVSTTSVALAIALAFLGYVTPDVLLHGKAADRSEAIRTALPDTLDQLTISVEAGLGFDAALQRVAATGDGPLADEMNRALNEITVGVPRSQALRSLADRTNVTELRHFVVSMIQAEQFGVPIARVLRVQSSELRIKRRQRAEERALKIPVKIVFPLVTCIFPALFIVLLGPALIRIMRTFS